jgi:NADP-dependent 3-hydroxy acid dehydrogenase YdfG
MWLPGVIGVISAQDIQSCVFSAAIGSLILTQKVLPTLCARPDADIHTIVSTSGLSYMPLGGTSIAFKAAKSAQDGFVHGMTDELSKTNVRVTAIYPGNFDDVSPLVPAWNSSKIPGDALTNREVVDAILFTLNLPPNAAVRTLVLE